MIDIGLYIKLVTYARLYLMTSVVDYSCFTCLLSVRLFMLLLFSCLFIMLFRYPMSAVYLVIILCTLFICTSSFLYTHSLGRFWRPWIRTSRVLDIFLYCQVFDETIHIARSLSLSFLHYRYSCSFIHVISWFYLYRIQLSFLSYIYLLSLC